MVDRLEELLALLDEEEDDGEWEDAPAVTAAGLTAPAPEIETENVPEGGVDKAASALEAPETLGEAGGVDLALEVRMPPGEAEGEAPGADDIGEGSAAGNGAAEFWLDGLAAVVMGPDGTAALRRPGAGDVKLEGLDRRSDQVGAAAEADAVMDSMRPAEQGLERLYRQAVQAGRPAAQSLPVEQAGRTLRAEEPGRTVALTVDELDRAVRRDSRRYDGGMTIF